jgi:hypothetical protein
MPLLVWSIAAFQTSAFVLILISLLYRNGGLGSVLSQLDTLVGLAIFCVLWFCTWCATRRALRGRDWSIFQEAGLSENLLVRGMLWGAATGALFLCGLLTVALTAGLVAQAARAPAARLPEIMMTPILGIAVLGILVRLAIWRRIDVIMLISIVFTVVSLGFAPAIGAMTGIAFAILYGITLELSKHIVGWSGARRL